MSRTARPVAAWVPPVTWVLSLAGLAISGYLTFTHFAGTQYLACADAGVVNCGVVTTSAQSYFLGIPVAVLGLINYAVLSVLNSPWAWRWRPYWVHVVRFVIAVGSMAFVLWLVAAEGIYLLTLGHFAPASVRALLGAVLTTRAGWMLLLLGNLVGFLFALAALVLGVMSFPMLVDRRVGVELAVRTSFEAVWRNKAVMAGWGLIVAAAMVVGSIPFLLGLAVALPVLGHATWHLYRRVVAFGPE